MKLQFNDVTIEVPSSWGEITLGDYERWFIDKPKDEMEYVRFVADVCKIEANTLLEAPSHVFEVIVDAISFISAEDFDPVSHIEIGGEKYFISYSDELTLGEWVDVESILESDSETKISEILSILCRPVGEKYDTRIAESRRELFRNLPCDKVLPLIAFFLRRKKQSVTILNHFLMVKDRTNQLLKDIDHFAKSGDGIKSLPIWQRIKYYFLIRSLKKQWSKFSDSFSIKGIEPQPKRSRQNFSNK